MGGAGWQKIRIPRTALGDLDGDADVDIVAVNWEQPHAVHVNDGRGRFSENQNVGSGKERAWSIAIGDLDLNGDLDAVVGNENVDWWRGDSRSTTRRT